MSSQNDRLSWVSQSQRRIVQDQSNVKDDGSKLDNSDPGVNPNQVASSWPNYTDQQYLEKTVGADVGVITYGPTEDDAPVITEVYYVDNSTIRIVGSGFGSVPLDITEVFITMPRQTFSTQISEGFRTIVNGNLIVVTRFYFDRSEQIRIQVRARSIMSAPYNFTVNKNI